mmetsp:Transcript_142359/g.354776  ORF Transcript_142359/g.354776 Transcript_142359/m.354776 type:complete len:214 (+) Transcript_142359:809-1450(+)
MGEVDDTKEGRIVRRRVLQLHELVDVAQGLQNPVWMPNDASQPVPLDGDIFDEHLRARVLPDPSDVGAVAADELRGHPYGDTEAKDELPRLLADVLGLRGARRLLLLPVLDDALKDPLKDAVEDGDFVGVDTQDAIGRVREVVASVAEDELGTCLLLDLVLFAALPAEQPSGQVIGAEDLEGISRLWNAISKVPDTAWLDVAAVELHSPRQSG